ncbi:UDP-4-amino-4,6-dideoxy-N-acetyl-beta-L-altrosamine N-acetyltransferase [Oceanithermus profundus]|uniref:UDP-4-amino-4, 6-dideoxy-N-acetyl-beta-L-altrosamine N-acetyltransferase n=1 Tax=Oceanithermus profundus TaxID=187137 RepID=UPI0011D281C0|nr:UDP-4-amino-4,6-dideoxy-N-acetyl-beta-L-altrosamine N-acetyltransferase [Oceanithermus profundus]
MTVRLRPVQQQDSELLRAWRNQPEVSKYMYSDHYISKQEHDAWFQRAISDPSRRMWIILFSEVPVGLASMYGISEAHRHAEWAFYLADPGVRGKGVGGFVEYYILKHAFEELNLHKLSCEVLSTNQPVINMHIKYGFKIEGVFREHIRKGDNYIDVVRLAILEQEWREIEREIQEKLRKRGML